MFYKRNSISNDTSTKTGVVGDGVVGGEKNGADFWWSYTLCYCDFCSIILMKKTSLVIEPKAKAKATESEERKLLRECCGKLSNGKLRESDRL